MATNDRWQQYLDAGREELSKLVRHEIQSQISALGIATQEDLARLERKLTKGSSAAKSAPKKASAAKKASPSSTAAEA
jgi:hypothetical protein